MKVKIFDTNKKMSIIEPNWFIWERERESERQKEQINGIPGSEIYGWMKMKIDSIFFAREK